MMHHLKAALEMQLLLVSTALEVVTRFRIRWYHTL